MKTNHITFAKACKNSKLGFQIHLIVFLLSTPVIWLTWFFTDTTYPWPLWSTSAWIVGVLFHYLGVYKFGRKEYPAY